MNASKSRPGAALPWLRTTVVAAAALAIVAACIVLAVRPGHRSPAADVVLSASSTAAMPPLPAAPVLTRTRVATFNMLGASHTAAGGNKKGWASGAQRMDWAAQIIRSSKMQIIGMQEFQVPQYNEFEKVLGSTYDVYPGRSVGDVAVQNSIAWNKSVWTLVASHTYDIPYFNGTPTPEPYVLLQNVSTGAQVLVYNSHNPASIKGTGNDAKFRAQAVADEVTLFKLMEKNHPGVPILDTGDKNDVAPYFCPIMSKTDFHAAAGGSYVGGTCTVPKPATIDWIFGSPGVSFSNYTILDSALVKKTTDHKVYYADATLPSLNTIRYVVGVDLEGLTSSKLSSSGIKLPNLHTLVSRGASATNARTAWESVGTLPNIAGMLTARPVALNEGGTNVKDTAGNPPSVTKSHHGYVHSVFDTVHDNGMGTAMWTTNTKLARLVSETWSNDHGANDTIGANNGRTKVAVIRTRTDKAAMTGLVRSLRRQPKAFSFLDLSAVENVARTYGNGSPKYNAALVAEDRYLGTLLNAINASSALRGHTAILLTSDHGGARRSQLTPTHQSAFQVPFLAWGPGIGAGTHIYARNPQLRIPGTSRPKYAGAQPVRNLDLGNVAVSLLGLPAISGSKIDKARGIRVVTSAS